MLEDNKYALSVHTRNVSAADLPRLDELVQGVLEEQAPQLTHYLYTQYGYTHYEYPLWSYTLWPYLPWRARGAAATASLRGEARHRAQAPGQLSMCMARARHVHGTARTWHVHSMYIGHVHGICIGYLRACA